VRVPVGDGHEWAVTAVTASSGSATLVYSRGKARPGYEMSLTAEWHVVPAAAGSAASAAARGTLDIGELADANGEDVFEAGSWRVAVTSGDAGKYAGVARARERDVREALRRWVETLKGL
jgi:hypothetical protein